MIEHANTSRSITAETVEMSADEKYLFDLLGFLIVRDVLSEEHLKLANDAIDSMELTPSPEYFGDSVALQGENTSTRLGNSEGLLELPRPFCEPFREMLAHPQTIPHLNTILGEGLAARPRSGSDRDGQGMFRRHAARQLRQRTLFLPRG